jgi:hypothetical protein
MRRASAARRQRTGVGNIRAPPSTPTGDRGLRTATTRDAEQVGSILDDPPRRLGHILPLSRIQHDDLGTKSSG